MNGKILLNRLACEALIANSFINLRKRKSTMSEFNHQIQYSDSPMIRSWQRIPVLIRAIVSGALVQTIGVGAWLLCLDVIPAPWSFAVMGGILWLYWKYFSGSWWPRATAEARRNNFRTVKISAAVWKWGLVAAFLFIIVFQSAAGLTFRLIEFPAEASADYGLDALPLWEAWITVVMASLVAGICEETGFRGYMQVPLEERFGPAVGIAIVSLMFTVFHLHQAWAQPVLIQIFVISVLYGLLAYASGSLIPSIIAHTIMDIFNFSFWWTDLAGNLKLWTSAERGIDIQLITWVLILIASFALFFWVIRKIMAVRQQT
jgi:membrane protease YdiL (CAAX protease family)